MELQYRGAMIGGILCQMFFVIKVELKEVGLKDRLLCYLVNSCYLS